MSKELNEEFIKVLAKFLINCAWPHYDKCGYSLKDVDDYREDMFDTTIQICWALTIRIIDMRQAKMIFNACWDMPYLQPWQYIYDNIDLFLAKDITEIVNKIISENDSVIQQIKSGNTKAIGNLIGKAIKLDNTINPKEFSDKLMQMITY